MAEFVAAGAMTSRRRPRRMLKPEAVPTKFSHREAVAEKKPRRESLYLKRKYDQSQEEVRQAPGQKKDGYLLSVLALGLPLSARRIVTYLFTSIFHSNTNKNVSKSIHMKENIK